MKFPQRWLLNIENKIFYLLILFLPTQFGKHFWPEFSIVSGIRIDYLSPTVYLNDILIFLLFICWLSKKSKNTGSKEQSYLAGNPRKVNVSKDNLKIKKFNFKLFICLFIFLFFNVFFSHNFLNGLYYLFKFLEFSFIGFYVAAYVTTIKELKKVILFLVFSVVIQSLLAIAQFFNQGSIGGLLYFLGERTFNSSTPGIANASINGELMLRPYATFPHPNVLAGFLLCVMILSLGFFRIYKNYGNKLIIIFSLFFGTIALVLTMSRIAVILWMFISLVFLFKQKLFNVKYKILSAFILILLLSFSPFANRLFSTNFNEESSVQRQELISLSFKIFNQNSIFGVGLGNFLPSLPSVQKSFPTTFYLQPVHNIFILVLIETGVVGFIFFIWFLIETYKHLLINLKTHAVFFMCLTAILILGLFDHYFLTLQQGRLLLSMVLGLCWVSLSTELRKFFE